MANTKALLGPAWMKAAEVGMLLLEEGFGRSEPVAASGKPIGA